MDDTGDAHNGGSSGYRGNVGNNSLSCDGNNNNQNGGIDGGAGNSDATGRMGRGKQHLYEHK